ncbi:MAG: hypothetical protein KDD69_03045 [Bdellovibrionales bacterium]|nr:hypothetical protein [Bdellovibrionales bacterium]
MEWLLGYFAVMIVIVAVVDLRRQVSPARFFVAERRVGRWFGSMSIAASWIWAPALFVSTQVGYRWGFSGLFWFVVPNMLALMLFGPFAQLVRARIPFGYSYLGYIRHRDRSFFRAQLCVQLLVQLVAFAIQLTAGAELLAHVSGTNYATVVAFMAFAPLVYTLLSGVSASILTDGFQYVLIVGVIAAVYWALPVSPRAALASVEATNVFDVSMLLQFGAASALTLVFGIFADHQQWQRAFSLRRQSVTATFIGAGMLHGVVTLSLGTLGVILASAGFNPDNQTILAAEYIKEALPPLYTGLFVVMVLCGLCSTIDSCLCAIGSLYALEFSQAPNILQISRWAMCCLAVVGFLLGICRVPIVTLWLTVGMLRISTISATVLSVLQKSFSGYAGTLSVLNSMLISGPIFVYATVANDAVLRTLAMILALALSLVSYLAVWFLFRDVRERPLANSLGELRFQEPEPYTKAA